MLNEDKFEQLPSQPSKLTASELEKLSAIKEGTVINNIFFSPLDLKALVVYAVLKKEARQTFSGNELILVPQRELDGF